MNISDIEDYNPCYTGHNVTIKSCFKRARRLSDENRYSGIMCYNADSAKVVFLCKQLSDLKKKLEQRTTAVI